MTIRSSVEVRLPCHVALTLNYHLNYHCNGDSLMASYGLILSASFCFPNLSWTNDLEIQMIQVHASRRKLQAEKDTFDKLKEVRPGKSGSRPADHLGFPTSTFSIENRKHFGWFRCSLGFVSFVSFVSIFGQCLSGARPSLGGSTAVPDDADTLSTDEAFFFGECAEGP